MLEFNRRIVWIPVKNMTGETIPGCGLMERYRPAGVNETGQDEDGNWLVRKPTVDGDSTVIVNGEAEIPPGETGLGHRDTMAVLRYDTTEDRPITGDRYGSKASSWQAHRDKAGFIIDSAGNGRANAQREFSGSGETWHVATVTPNNDGNSVVADTGGLVSGMGSAGTSIYDHGYITIDAGKTIKGLAYCTVRMVGGNPYYPDRTRFFTSWTTGTGANAIPNFPSNYPYFGSFNSFTPNAWVVYPGMFGDYPATNPVPVVGMPMVAPVYIEATNSDGVSRLLAIRRTDSSGYSQTAGFNQMDRGNTFIHYRISE